VTPEDPETTETEPDSSTASTGPPPNTARLGSTAPAPNTSERMATQIEEDVNAPLPWRSIAKRTVAVVLFGITIYLVFPSLAAVFSSFPKLTSLEPIWFTIALALEVASFVCTIALQRIALRTKAWYSVTTSQLAGNAISLVVPGGAAVGAATQFRMLAKAGNDTTTTVGGLTAFSLLNIAGLLALPIFVLPAILAGTPIAHGLLTTALLGLAGFVLFTGFAAAVLLLDGPMRWIGRVVQAARNRWRRKADPMTDLPERLVRERNSIRDVLGRRWKEASLLSSGRLFFDFGCLLATIRATGAKPNPSLVLLAYAVAGLLKLIPITPGGLGIVEAGLSGLLILAGVAGGSAVVATLAYRIISYWLPILVGPFAYFAFRARYGAPPHDSGGGQDGGTTLTTG
jgi:uncharacterized protein (TIRG00374 family)